jgi:hypothetical protein
MVFPEIQTRKPALACFGRNATEPIRTPINKSRFVVPLFFKPELIVQILLHESSLWTNEIVFKKNSKLRP